MKFKIYHIRRRFPFTPRNVVIGCKRIIGGLNELKAHQDDPQHKKIYGQMVWRVFSGTKFTNYVDPAKTIHANTNTDGNYHKTSNKLGLMENPQEWLVTLHEYLGQLGLTGTGIESLRDKLNKSQESIIAKTKRKDKFQEAHTEHQLERAKLESQGIDPERYACEKIKGHLEQALIAGGQRFNRSQGLPYFNRFDHIGNPLVPTHMDASLEIHRPFSLGRALTEIKGSTATYHAIFNFDKHKLVISDKGAFVDIAEAVSKRYPKYSQVVGKALDYTRKISDLKETNRNYGMYIQETYHPDGPREIGSDFVDFLNICHNGYRKIKYEPKVKDMKKDSHSTYAFYNCTDVIMEGLIYYAHTHKRQDPIAKWAVSYMDKLLQKDGIVTQHYKFGYMCICLRYRMDAYRHFRYFNPNNFDVIKDVLKKAEWAFIKTLSKAGYSEYKQLQKAHVPFNKLMSVE